MGNILGRGILITIIAVIGAVMMSSVAADDSETSSEQVAVSPTPFRASIPTAAPPATAAVVETPLPTATPTDEGPPQLEAKESAGPVNVRSEADPESEILGRIRFGERYTVTGRFYRWLQIRFEPSPTRIAYVFEDLVDIIGDEAAIPDLTILPTADDPAARATETWQAVQELPGGELTVTAEARVLAGGDAPEAAVGVDEANAVEPSSVLPTFTYPPNVVALAPTEDAQPDISPTPDPIGIDLSVSGGIAPIVPILVLGGLGVIGLLISMVLRR